MDNDAVSLELALRLSLSNSTDDWESRYHSLDTKYQEANRTLEWLQESLEERVKTTSEAAMNTEPSEQQDDRIHYLESENVKLLSELMRVQGLLEAANAKLKEPCGCNLGREGLFSVGGSVKVRKVSVSNVNSTPGKKKPTPPSVTTTPSNTSLPAIKTTD
jgi:hypothetical protein